MPPHELLYGSIPKVYSLPLTTNQKRAVSIAIRVWHAPIWSTYVSGGLDRGVRIGEKSQVEKTATLLNHDRAWQLEGYMSLAMLEILVGIAALALFVSGPERGNTCGSAS